MYEWRIFQKLKHSSFKEFEEYLHKIWMPSIGYFIEPRVDLYIIIPSNVNQDFGLKLRDMKFQQKKQKYKGRKLELKVKYSTGNQKIEQWKKIIQHKMDKKVKVFNDIQQNTGQIYSNQIFTIVNELSRCLQNVKEEKINGYLNQLKQFLNNQQAKLILVTKYQCKQMTDEQTLIEIRDLQSNQIQYFITCSVEAYQEKDLQIQQMVQSWEKRYEKISQGFIGGYPEFLQQIF